MPSASLAIGSFYTTLTVDTGGGRQRHNVTGTPDDGDWNNNPTGYLRHAADRHLSGLGWRRDGDWSYDYSRDIHAAPITAN
ncbi:hypothetical protein GCM10011608_11020 [Micromonospora sonchi]|uniref:Uncharacterized protein n=1 Tax=Micromonospora sonchi TaxID=1763543 RepID=A0A917TLT3_9ACTN|nr:hypothetical protein [Micromonospora sonchi]GGM27977.1 hypothetical protein GCM10011608_11020 [Micromonospora sonchi]